MKRAVRHQGAIVRHRRIRGHVQDLILIVSWHKDGFFVENVMALDHDETHGQTLRLMRRQLFRDLRESIQKHQERMRSTWKRGTKLVVTLH